MATLHFCSRILICGAQAVGIMWTKDLRCWLVWRWPFKVRARSQRSHFYLNETCCVASISGDTTGTGAEDIWEGGGGGASGAPGPCSSQSPSPWWRYLHFLEEAEWIQILEAEKEPEAKQAFASPWSFFFKSRSFLASFFFLTFSAFFPPLNP